VQLKDLSTLEVRTGRKEISDRTECLVARSNISLCRPALIERRQAVPGTVKGLPYPGPALRRLNLEAEGLRAVELWEPFRGYFPMF
jgi:hypothetical protein